MKVKNDQLNLIAIKEFSKFEDMYKIVDFLNKNLKGKGLIFGLSVKDGKDVISIYETLNLNK